MSKIHRLQIDFTEKGFAQLEDLRKFAGYDSYAETVRHALGLLWAHLEDSQGITKEVEVTPLDQ